MSIQRIQQLAKRVILQLLADPRSLVLIVVVPIILLTVAGILIRLEPEGIIVGVVNRDTGIAGERFTTLLQSFDAFQTEILTSESAQQKLEAAEVDAVITLPPDLTQQALQSRQLTLDIEYEGSNPTIARRLESMFERVTLQAVNSINTIGSESAPAITLQTHVTYLNGGAAFDTLDFMAPALIGVFVFLFVFILTSISFLRERIAGTLERLQATPIKPLEIIIGYMMGFLLFGLLQGLITLLYTVFVLDINYTGNLLNVFIVEILLVITSVNLGIFMSTFAHNEFQVLQFIPLVVVTQVFLGGMLWEVEDMPAWLQPIAQVMPLTHATRALRDIMIKGASLSTEWASLLALVVIGSVVILLSARTAGRVRL